MEQRVVKIDLLDYLFSNVGIFHKLDVAGKRKIFNSRPQPVFDVVLDVVNDKKYVTPFDPKYYSDFPWITACPKRKVLFCFVCLLQGKTVESVICARNDVIVAASAHEVSSSHMTCYDACLQVVQNPSKTSLVDPKRQFVVRKKRTILGKLLQTLYLLKCQSYLDKCGISREFAFKIVDFMALNDVNFSLDWEQFFPEIIKDPKSESALFSTFRTLVVEHIKSELSQCDFVSMQIEDVSEYVAKPTISVSFRFILNDKIVERFAGFYELIDYGCKIDEGTLVDILSYWEVNQKTIGISSDFHIQRLPTLVPDRPFGLFNVTSSHHRMPYVVVKIAAIHREVREFLGKAKVVTSFFADVASDLFVANGDEIANVKLPDKLTRSDEPIDVHVMTIYSHLKDLCDHLAVLKKNSNVSIHNFLLVKVDKLLRDPYFVFYAGYFSKLFDIGKDMTDILTTSFGDAASMGKLNVLTRIQELTGALGPIDDEKPIDVRKSNEYKYLNHKIIASVLKDFDARDKNQTNFSVAQLFLINQNREKGQDVGALVRATLDAVLTETKGLLDFNVSRLKIEIQNIFRDPNKILPPGQLYDQMLSTGSINVYSEFAKLLKFYLVLPTSSGQNDGATLYRRIKTFSRVTRGSGDVFDMDYLIIEQDLSMKLLGDRDFLGYLINQFAKSQGLEDVISD